MIRFTHLFAATLILCFSFNAQAKTSYIEGKDYLLIADTPGIPSFPKNSVTVSEFFSYGCPWCYELEPQLKEWQKPSYVVFDRVPVIFEKNWDNYAKAYYVAQALDIEKKITPSLFKAIQEQNRTFENNQAMEAFFISMGVDPNVAENAFSASPTLDAEIKQGTHLMRTYQVYVVPTVVIDGKYKTDLRMAMSEKKFINILQFLVAKRATEKNIPH